MIPSLECYYQLPANKKTKKQNFSHPQIKSTKAFSRLLAPYLYLLHLPLPKTTLGTNFQTQCYKHANPKGLSRARSKLSMRLVGKIPFTSAHASNPSNWFNNSNIVLWISHSPPECASYLPSNARTSETHSTTHPSSLNYQKCTCGGRTVVQEENLPLCPDGPISLIKTMDGESSSTTRKSFRTNLGPSPKYFCISSLPTTRKNVADVEFATACSKFQP